MPIPTPFREHLVHLMPILIHVPLSASISVLSLDIFQPSTTKCYYVSVYSPFEWCRFDPEVKCDEGFLDKKVLSFLWLIHSYIIIPVVILVSMLVIYREVAAQERRNNIHRFFFTSSTTRPSETRKPLLTHERLLQQEIKQPRILYHGFCLGQLGLSLS